MRPLVVCLLVLLGLVAVAGVAEAATLPYPSISSNSTYGQAPLFIQFYGYDLNNTVVTEWLWAFGDGSTSNVRNATHSYNSTGTYSVSLAITNANGTSYLYDYRITVYSETMLCALRATTRGILFYPNALIYAAAGSSVVTNTTDSSGRVVLPMIPGMKYNITIVGSSVGLASNVTSSLYVEYGKYSYDLEVPLNLWGRMSGWISTVSQGIIGSPDVTLSVTTEYSTTGPNGTNGGSYAIKYNDTTGGTTSIAFRLYHRNLTSYTYDLVQSQTISANNATATFYVLNCGNQTYKCNVTGTSTIYGQVNRTGGEYTYPGTHPNPFEGWPTVTAIYLGLLVPTILAFLSTRRYEVAGGILIVVFSWGLTMAGLAPWWGAVVSAVVLILIIAWAVAKWREEHL